MANYESTHTGGQIDSAVTWALTHAQVNVTQLNANLNAERTQRQAATASLQAQILAETEQRRTDDEAAQAKILAETEQRRAADTSLQGQIQAALNVAKGMAQAIVVIDYAALVTILNNATAADYALGRNILVKKAGVPDVWISAVHATAVRYTYTNDTAITNALTRDGYLRVGYYEISSLEVGQVDLTEYAKSADVNTQVGNETTARQSADTALGNRITSETSARQSADTSLGTRITNETSARQSADTTLQNNITSEANRATAREDGIEDDLDAETTAREEADTALGNRISTLENKSTDTTAARTSYSDSATALGATNVQAALEKEVAARKKADADEATLRAKAVASLETKCIGASISVEYEVGPGDGSNYVPEDVRATSTRLEQMGTNTSVVITLNAGQVLTTILPSNAALYYLPNGTPQPLAPALRVAVCDTFGDFSYTAENAGTYLIFPNDSESVVGLTYTKTTKSLEVRLAELEARVTALENNEEHDENVNS